MFTNGGAVSKAGEISGGIRRPPASRQLNDARVVPVLRSRSGSTRARALRPTIAGSDQTAQLCAGDLMSFALEKERRSSFADTSFVEPLRRLISSLNNEAKLSAFGRRAARFDIIRCLTNLLRLDAEEEKVPEIASRAIDRPVFIAGLPRSGTTFLHGLLAQDTGNAVPRCWQCIYPYPFRSRFPFGDWRKMQVALQLGIYRFIAPEVAELHHVAADDPQECSDITAHIFHSLRFDSMYHIPSYQAWVARRDHLDAYHFHKRFLRHLGRQQPGRRWILKSPDHVFALDAICAVYPDAAFVFLHRDPMTVLASQLNLTAALRRSFASHFDLGEIGATVGEAIVETANRLVARRKMARVLHLDFHSLIAAPLDAVRQVYEHAGMSLTPKASGRMSHWLRGQKPYCARPYRRDLSQFGLDPHNIAARFDRYLQAFDIARGRITAEAA